MTNFRRVSLNTGVTLNVALAGDPANPAVILLHGFPESHRTWREVGPRLDDRFFVVMPDQRGFAGSDLPQDVDDPARRERAGPCGDRVQGQAGQGDRRGEGHASSLMLRTAA